MKKTVKLEIVATGHKLNQDDSLLVLVSPEWQDFSTIIGDALHALTGHNNHVILPIPAKDIKIFSIKHPINVEMKLSSDAAEELPNTSLTKVRND